LLKEGATIDKFIGDAIMAEFGAPLSQDDHAARALRSAVALYQVAVEFRLWMETRFAGRDLPRFDIGIGIHTGDAVVGNIGASSRMEYTAIGDTVNTASRLEGMTKEVGVPILASLTAAEEAGTAVRIGARYSLKVKGRSEPVAACEIQGIS
jgi:adenylate cyclase